MPYNSSVCTKITRNVPFSWLSAPLLIKKRTWCCISRNSREHRKTTNGNKRRICWRILYELLHTYYCWKVIQIWFQIFNDWRSKGSERKSKFSPFLTSVPSCEDYGKLKCIPTFFFTELNLRDFPGSLSGCLDH
jgi:hypothetical protein